MESANLDLEENKEIASKFERALGMGATLAELHGITPDTLEGVYAYAYNFYEKGRLDEAELFFKFLCIYDFQNYNYLKGYARLSVEERLSKGIRHVSYLFNAISR